LARFSAEAAARRPGKRLRVWLAALDRKTGLYTTLVFAWFELRKAHAANSGGLLWSVLTPLGQCLIYVFMFAFVFKVRFPLRAGVEGGPAEFTIYILSGLVPWFLVSTMVLGGTDMVQQYASFIRQPNFPYRIIPTVVLLVALPAHLAGLAVLIVMLSLVDLGYGGPLWLPLAGAYVCAFFALRGLATMLGLLTMYVRDLRHLIALAISFLIYFSPVFYAPGQMPPKLHPLLLINPFAYGLACFKYGYTADPATALLGPAPDLAVFAGLAALGWLMQRHALAHFRSKGIDAVE
jgi:ABC-type polysaccharide/polyol phosphate export permease